MAKSSAAGLLTSVDSMFTTQEERDNAQRSYVTDLPTAEISDFPDHPFKVRMDESMTEMVSSVKERGVLSPVLVRPMPDGGYQMVSGHRRKMAAERAVSVRQSQEESINGRLSDRIGKSRCTSFFRRASALLVIPYRP